MPTCFGKNKQWPSPASHITTTTCIGLHFYISPGEWLCVFIPCWYVFACFNTTLPALLVLLTGNGCRDTRMWLCECVSVDVLTCLYVFNEHSKRSSVRSIDVKERWGGRTMENRNEVKSESKKEVIPHSGWFINTSHAGFLLKVICLQTLETRAGMYVLKI